MAEKPRRGSALSVWYTCLSHMVYDVAIHRLCMLSILEHHYFTVPYNSADVIESCLVGVFIW